MACSTYPGGAFVSETPSACLPAGVLCVSSGHALASSSPNPSRTDGVTIPFSDRQPTSVDCTFSLSMHPLHPYWIY